MPHHLEPDRIFLQPNPRREKSSAVVTLTDYAKDPERDQALLNACAANDENLFFFPQSSADIPYFHAVLPAELAGKFNVIAPDLAEYDRFLTEIQPDFIGTRLHGGIRALQHRCRVLIIGIDNRAKEMGKDISLPFLPQKNMKELPGLLQNGWDIALKIPQKILTSGKTSSGRILLRNQFEPFCRINFSNRAIYCSAMRVQE